MIGLKEEELRRVAKERAVRMNTYDPSTGLFGEDKLRERYGWHQQRGTYEHAFLNDHH